MVVEKGKKKERKKEGKYGILIQCQYCVKSFVSSYHF